MTTAYTPADARLLTLADELAVHVRKAIDAFEMLEAVALDIGAQAESERTDAIMAEHGASDIIEEMLACRPSTFAGFQALEMARLWERGEYPGMDRA
ncbi:hypothetical protein [Devosia sp. Naph2]|uniref:hypothetical protein n=1 Tax=Devosia polycyclovorans TaxID=3345148 RepID=UPI0035CF9745